MRPTIRLALFTLAVMLAGSTGQAADERVAINPPPGEEVVVRGVYPGPGLWRVTKGDHLLWILGTHAPLPQHMTWQSAEVELAISTANEVLGAYSVVLSVDEAEPMKPRDTTLKQTLNHRDYRRWTELKARYLGEMDTENLLPATAALLLQASAYESAGLTYADQIWQRIHELAAQYRIPVRPQDYVTEPLVRHAVSAREARRAGAGFLKATMDRLDSDIATARERARAWAVGDIEALVATVRADRSYYDLLARSWPYVRREDVPALMQQAENKLFESVDRALSRNETTFAALPLSILLRDDGLLMHLEALGYEVLDPE